MCLRGNYGGFYEKVFAWSPNEEQWWITGFNPDTVGQANVKKQVTISCINLSKFEDLYSSLKKTSYPDDIDYNDELKKFGLFDDDKQMLWLMWYSD